MIWHLTHYLKVDIIGEDDLFAGLYFLRRIGVDDEASRMRIAGTQVIEHQCKARDCHMFMRYSSSIFSLNSFAS
uniref:Uncharacterized protein n=1 Tax=Oryza meridionalis TaxID=40149 RepID=A0A0E0E4H6_9ORYZ